MKSEFIFRSNGRKHPHREDTKFNTNLWGYRSIETGNVFDTQAEADKDKKAVVVKRAPRKKVTKE